MRVRVQGSLPTLLRTSAQAVISVTRFAAAAFAAATPLILGTGLAVLYGILTAAAGVGVGWAWLVSRTRDDHSDFDTEVQLISEAFRYKVSSVDVAG